MNQLRALPAFLVLACSGPAICAGCSDGGDDAPAGELPASFDIEAEIVSVMAVAPIGETACDPRTVDAAGPDWVVRFIHTDTVPQFSSISGSTQAVTCSSPDHCCTAPEPRGDGWRISCAGHPPAAIGQRPIVFDFAADGSGTATSTASGGLQGGSCTSIVAWAKTIPR